jgi:hypothetical protein
MSSLVTFFCPIYSNYVIDLKCGPGESHVHPFGLLEFHEAMNFAGLV